MRTASLMQFCAAATDALALAPKNSELAAPEDRRVRRRYLHQLLQTAIDANIVDCKTARVLREYSPDPSAAKTLLAGASQQWVRRATARQHPARPRLSAR